MNYALVGAYLLGAIPFGWLIGRAKGIDLSKAGSGSTGATNVWRILGPLWGSVTFGLDTLKGLLATTISWGLTGDLSWGMVGGLLAIAGHCFPIYRLFRPSGKGVATTLGVIIALQPLAAAMSLVVWLLVLIKTKYVSLASLLATVTLVGYQHLTRQEWSVRWAMTLIGLVIVVRHKDNIVRLINHKESRFSLGSQKERPICQVGFVIHAVSSDPKETKRRLVSKFAFFKIFPAWILHHWVMPRLPIGLLRMGYAFDVESSTGAKVSMVFYAVPYDPNQMLKLQPVKAVAKAGRCCAKHGARLIGLGAHTSIIGGKTKGGGRGVAEQLNPEGVSVTTGNSLTAASGVEGLLELARQVGRNPSQCTVAVIGAGGSIGKVCAELLATRVGRLLLATRKIGDEPYLVFRLRSLVGDKTDSGDCNARVAQVTVEQAIRQADMLVTVTSDTGELDINPSWFKPGAIVCDIARPRDIGPKVAEARPDVLVFEGAILEIPGSDVRITCDFGFPPKTTYACMAETLVLGLEGRLDHNFSIGELSLVQVQEIWALAKKHGFKLAGWRSFDKPLAQEDIDRFTRELCVPTT